MTKRLAILLLCCALAISSCRRGGAGPTSQPTLTPTPRSTSLPPVPTPIPVGAAGNRIHIVFPIVNSVRSDQVINAALNDLEDALTDESGLNVVAERVDSDAEALAALCNSISGTVSLAWLNGIAYAAAEAQGCGTAALQVQRDERTAERAFLIANRNSRITSIAELDGADFCRISVTDFYTWLIPSILMAANGFAASDLRSVTDYEDVNALIEAVNSGECDAAGVSQTDFDAASASNAVALSGAADVPIAVLAYPEALPSAQRQALLNALNEIAGGTRAELLEPLLEQDSIVPADSGELSGIRSLISRAGIDLAAMNGQ